jgi:hypothetical protein
MSGFGERLNQRQKGFKKGVDAEDARRKREDAAVQLRKQTRDEALQKKRMVNDLPPGQLPVNPLLDMGMPGGGAASMQTGFGGAPSFPLDQIPALSQMLMSDDPQAQFNATQQYRKLLSIEQIHLFRR